MLTDSDPERLPQLAIQALLADTAWPKRIAWIGVPIPSGLFLLLALEIGGGAAVSTYLVASFLVGFILKGVFAWEAVAVLAEARRVGALELVLTTPVTDRDIWAAQRKHMRDTFLVPMVVLFGLDYVVGVGASNFDPQGEYGVILVLSLVGGLLTILQCQAMILGGLWWGVREERPTIAFAKNFLLCTGLSTALMWVCCSGFFVPLVLISWLTAKLRMPLRVLLTEKNPRKISA